MGTIVQEYQVYVQPLSPSRWVRLTSATTPPYLSQAQSDPATGLAIMSGQVPNGTYSLSTSQSLQGPWTVEDSAYVIAANPPTVGTKSLTLGGIVYDALDPTFGLAYDLSTDDAAKLSAAETTINGLGGGIFYFPSGGPALASRFTAKAKIKHLGAGSQATVIKAKAGFTDFAMLEVTANDVSAAWLTLDATAIVSGGSNNGLITVYSGAARFRATEVEVFSAWAHGIELQSSTDSWVEDGHFRNIGDQNLPTASASGVYVHSGAKVVTITGDHFRDITRNLGHGILLFGDAALAFQDVVVGDCTWLNIGAVEVASTANTTYDATHATDGSATFVVNQWNGAIVKAGTSWGIAQSNTATSVTVDSWRGGTPASTTVFKQSVPGGNCMSITGNGQATRPRDVSVVGGVARLIADSAFWFDRVDQWSIEGTKISDDGVGPGVEVTDASNGRIAIPTVYNCWRGALWVHNQLVPQVGIFRIDLVQPQAHNAGQGLNTTTGHGIVVKDDSTAGTWAGGIKLIGGGSWGAQNQGIDWENVGDSEILGPVCMNNGGSGSSANGIYIKQAAATVGTLNVKGGRSGDTRVGGARTQQYGIYLDTPSASVNVEGVDVTNNVTLGLNDQSGQTTNTLRNCPGFNPVGVVTPAVPLTGVAVAAVNYDRTFYITTGAGATTIAIAGGPTVTLQASAAGQCVRVPAGKTLTPTFTNAPTWVVEGE